jgi:hypothetical protein
MTAKIAHFCELSQTALISDVVLDMSSCGPFVLSRCWAVCVQMASLGLSTSLVECISSMYEVLRSSGLPT